MEREAGEQIRARTRVLSNWVQHAFAGDDLVRLGFMSDMDGRMGNLEQTEAYLSQHEVAVRTGSPAAHP